MGKWSSESASHVATMKTGDFASNEKSVTISETGTVKIQLVNDTNTITLKEELGFLKEKLLMEL